MSSRYFQDPEISRGARKLALKISRGSRKLARTYGYKKKT